MNQSKGGVQLALQTLSLVAGFMAWSIIAPLIPFISQDIKISSGQLSIILAIPVILGSVLRVPFGYLTNIVGAKWVFFTSFIVLLVPIFLLSQAGSPGALMFAGFFLGVGGAIFSVGVTSLPKYFSKDKVGLANGIVSMMGGLGGFFPPLVISAVTSITGTSHFAFILLCVFGLIALVTMFNLSKREKAAANKATVS
ncbi:TPA: MFS transporter [Staphylococcus pseudintermedius]|nr:MFS transporter [Staphylococcus pseudintermedius]